MKQLLQSLPRVRLATGIAVALIAIAPFAISACSEAPKQSRPGAGAPAESQPRADAPSAGAPKDAPSQPESAERSESSDGAGRRHYKAKRYSTEAPTEDERKSAEEPSEPAGGAPPPAELGQGAPAPVPSPAPAAEPPPPPVAAAPPPVPSPPPSPAAEPPPPPVAAAPPPAASAPPSAARSAAPPPAPVTPSEDKAKEYDVVPVFYGTDRAAVPDPNRLQFGSERGHVLQLGRAMVTVPTIHKVPNIERPWVIEIPYFKVKIYEEKEDPAKHFTLQEITSLTGQQMLVLIKERLGKSSTFKDHAFVFVHGFNTSFDCALFRTAQIAYDLKFDGAPFLYSWPSGGAVASYTYDRGSVEQAEPLLADFLKMVVQKSGAKSISLIAHSMGNELLLRVLERLRPKVPDGVVISQVILAAPDVDRDKFNIIAREITNFAQGVTLYAASNDRALGYSARFWGAPRAGDVPQKVGPLIVPGVDTIDVTEVSTDALGLNHSGYAENPALLNDVKALVEFGLRPPDKRVKDLITMQTESGGTFWKFPKAPPPPP